MYVHIYSIVNEPYIHIHTHVHVRMYSVHAHVCKYVYVRMYVRTCPDMYFEHVHHTQMYSLCLYICTYVHTYVLHKNRFMSVHCKYVHSHTPNWKVFANSKFCESVPYLVGRKVSD